MSTGPLLALASVVLVAFAIGSPAAADGGDDRADIRARGACTGTSASTLRIRLEEGTLRIEVRIDSSRRGRSWTLVVLRERRIAFRGTLRPAGGSRSVRLRRTFVDWPGAEQVVVRAAAADGETCRASAVA